MCVVFKTKKCFTHTNNKHGTVLSLLHDRLPFMHASAWYIMFFCIFFWSHIISNTFRCVWTPAPFCCTLWILFYPHMTFSFHEIWQFLELLSQDFVYQRAAIGRWSNHTSYFILLYLWLTTKTVRGPFRTLTQLSKHWWWFVYLLLPGK